MNTLENFQLNKTFWNTESNRWQKWIETFHVSKLQQIALTFSLSLNGFNLISASICKNIHFKFRRKKKKMRKFKQIRYF